MTFWGVELKPGKPFTLESVEDVKLILTQATLGAGASTKKSSLQVTVGDADPVLLCNLLPEKAESCSLNLEFDEDDDVKFSVVGPSSIHISGFLQRHEAGGEDFDSDDSEGIEGADSEDSEFELGDDSEEDFISDDDVPMFPPSPARSSGVVIEEIEDEEKPANENGGNKKAKKKKDSDSDKKAQQQLVVKGSTGASVLESEDEDGFPVSSKGKSNSVNSQSKTESKATNEGKKKKSDAKEDGDSANNLKRKVDAMEQDIEPEREAADAKKKKKKKNKKADKSENEGAVENIQQNASEVSNAQQSASKDNKKVAKADKETKQSDKAAKVRTFANGLKIEELAMGKPNGRRASHGKKVSIHYTGKLQKNGKIFDSSINRKPLKFRLGVGQVIKGWDTGIEGMRVGDKRRLTIPPAFAYGADGAPPQIPPNAWLVFDVELVEVA